MNIIYSADIAESGLAQADLYEQLSEGNKRTMFASLVKAIAGGSVAKTSDVIAIGGANASGTVTISVGAPANNDTVTIAGRVYTFKTALTGAADEILIGGSIANATQNLIDAINRTGTPGTQYSSATVKNVTVRATAGAAGVTNVISRYAGTIGNYIPLAESGTNIAVSGAALTGGTNGEAV